MSAARKIFRLSLALYPHAYRVEFGSEMAELFELRMMASHSRMRFVISEVAGLILGAAREWFRPRMQPPYAGGERYDSGHLPHAVVHARLRVDSAVQRMVYAISHHQFEEARRLSNEERMERENLRRICDDYGIDAV